MNILRLYCSYKFSTQKLYSFQNIRLDKECNKFLKFYLVSLNTSDCTVFLQDLGHLPETKIQKFLHEPVNAGRSVQHKEHDPVTQTAPAEAIATPQPREGICQYG